jgi:menaquinone-9 beta-reductase
VLVLGGGPAGAAVAGALAARGLDVLLVHDGAPRSPARGLETASPSLAMALAPFGRGALAERVAPAALDVPRPLLGRWPQAGASAEASVAEGDGPGFTLLDRDHFDSAVQAWAQDRGVRWCRSRGTPAADGAPRLRLADGTALQARLLIDARGRRAAPPDGLRTVALMARLRMGAEHGVEARPDGWLWSAGCARQGVVAAFGDARTLAGLNVAGRRAWLAQALAASPAFARWAGAFDATSVHDATPRHADAAPAPARLRVGDAATALSPLASQGLAAALRSAWQAAACAATALDDPAQAALAWAFHRERQQAVAAQHGRLAAHHHAAAAADFGAGLWADRSAASPVTPQRPWPALQQRLRPSRLLRQAEVAALENERIVRRPALVHPALATPLVWLAGVPAASWLDALPPEATLAQALDRWQALYGAERTAAAWPRLWQDGLVVAASDAEAEPPSGPEPPRAAEACADLS